MDGIKKRLDRFWDERFGLEYRSDVRTKKVIRTPDGTILCEIIHSQKLEDWYKSPEGIARYNKPSCFFCERHDQFNRIDVIETFGHLDIFFNLKFVAPCHFLITSGEHRENVSFEDMLALQGFADATGLSVFGNFRDSGASYPAHVHYQSLDVEFPLVHLPLMRETFYRDIKVARLHYPVAAFAFTPIRAGGDITIAKLVSLLPLPFNSLFWRREVFVVPRIKSVPSNTRGFKFAAAEVMGTIFCRTRELFDFFDYDNVMTALCDVCRSGHAADIYEIAIQKILSTIYEEETWTI